MGAVLAGSRAAADPSPATAQRLLAEAAIAQNDADRAVAYAEKAAALAPADATCQHTLGVAYGTAAEQASIFKQFGLARKCLAAFQRAVALAPANVEFHQSLFDYYRQAPGIAGGGLDKAAAEAAVINGLDPRSGTLSYALLNANDKKFALAQSQLDSLLKNAPDDFEALYQTGRIAAMSGQGLDRGLAALRRCLQLPPPTAVGWPGLASVHWRMGNILEQKGDKPGARAAYAAALAGDPKFSPAAQALKKL